MLCCTKCNESRNEGTQPSPWEHKQISKKAPRLELYNQNLPLQKEQVGSDLYMSWWNSKVFSAPFANILCAGGGRGSWLSPMESCHFSRGHSFFTGRFSNRDNCVCDRAHGPARNIVGHSLRTGIAISKLRKCHIIRGCHRDRWDSKVQPEDICQGVCFSSADTALVLWRIISCHCARQFSKCFYVELHGSSLRCVQQMGVQVSGRVLAVGWLFQAS